MLTSAADLTGTLLAEALGVEGSSFTLEKAARDLRSLAYDDISTLNIFTAFTTFFGMLHARATLEQRIAIALQKTRTWLANEGIGKLSKAA